MSRARCVVEDGWNVGYTLHVDDPLAKLSLRSLPTPSCAQWLGDRLTMSVYSGT